VVCHTTIEGIDSGDGEWIRKGMKQARPCGIETKEAF